jgi:hypothetical protein
MYGLLKACLLVIAYQAPLMGEKATNSIAAATSYVVKEKPVFKVEKSNLFVIKRNTDKNLVVYDANLLSNKALDPEKPVSIYWIRNTEGGIVKELNYLQRRLAYGMELTKIDNGTGAYEGKIAAYDKRVVRITFDKVGKPIALIIINGKWQQLQHISLHIKDPNAFIPKVTYLEIVGRDLTSGAVISEKVIP